MNLARTWPITVVCLLACAHQQVSPGSGQESREPDTATTNPSSSGVPIEFAGYRFDPRDGLPEVPGDLAELEPGLFIVQLHDTKDRAELVQDLSLSLSAYIPTNGYRKLLTGPQVERARTDRRIRAVVGFPAAFKLSEAMREQAPSDLRPLTVVCHPGAAPAETLAALQSLGVGTVSAISMPPGHPPRFRVRDVKPGAARRIASVPGTVWIEHEPSIDPD